MARIAIFLFLLFAILLALRLIGSLLRSLSSRGRAAGPMVNGEMVRDPVCGTWIDRRLAMAGRSGSEWLPVCSEKCRLQLESE